MHFIPDVRCPQCGVINLGPRADSSFHCLCCGYDWTGPPAAEPIVADPTVAELRESWRVASRKPGMLETWAFQNVPKMIGLLERLQDREDGSRFSDAPTCPGVWLCFVRHMDLPFVVKVYDVDDWKDTKGRKWYGPLPAVEWQE